MLTKFLVLSLNIVRVNVILRIIKIIYRSLGGICSSPRSFSWVLGRINDPAVLNKYIPNWYTPRTNRIVRTKTIENVIMDLELDDHIQFRAFMDGGFDFMPVIIAKYLCSGKTYIDVGANVGTTCLPVAKTGIKTLAIEASPHILGKLYRNLSLNPGLDLMVLGVALGDVDNEIIQMYLPGGGNLGAASLYKDWNNNQKDTRIEKQYMFMLDTILENYKVEGVGLIKFDIEGHEEPAIRGSKSVLDQAHPALLFEWRPDVAKRSKLDIKTPLSILPDGYKCFSLNTSKICKTGRYLEFTINLGHFDENKPYENVLCLSSVNSDHSLILEQASSNKPIEQAIELR